MGAVSGGGGAADPLPALPPRAALRPSRASGHRQSNPQHVCPEPLRRLLVLPTGPPGWRRMEPNRRRSPAS